MFSNPFLAFSTYRPHEPACAQGAGRGDLPRNPSTGRPVPQAFFVKGERPRTHSSKKKIMKTNTNSDSRLQNRTAQHNSEQLHRIDFSQRFYNRGLSTEKVLDLLYHETPRLWELAEVVGKWVWIQFEHRQRDEADHARRLAEAAQAVLFTTTQNRDYGHQNGHQMG